MKRNTIRRALVLGMAMSLVLAGTAGAAQGNKHGNKKGKKGSVAQAQVQPGHGNGPKVKPEKHGGGPAVVEYQVPKPRHGRANSVRIPNQHVKVPKVNYQQTAVTSARLPKGARAVAPQIETRVRSFSGRDYNQVLQGYSREYQSRDYWSQRYNRFELVNGGYYYINNGYWYPAWGYDSAYSRYTYDIPVYAYHGLPPDQVLREAQSQLRNLGYYRGSVDGLFGPMTRTALRGFQSEYGLPVTGAADEATLYALGMS